MGELEEEKGLSSGDGDENLRILTFYGFIASHSIIVCVKNKSNAVSQVVL